MRLVKASGRGQDFHLSEGKEYLVVGLQFAVGSNIHGTGTWLHLVNDNGHLSWAPLSLFDVLDPRVSRLWEIRQPDATVVTMWPPLLYREFFHEDLADADPNATGAFADLMRALETEAAEPR